MIQTYQYRVELDENKLPILVKESTLEYEDGIHQPCDVAKFLQKLNIQNLAEEHVYLICCTTKTQIVGVFELSHGTAATSLIGLRELCIRALLCGATSIFVAHNHPSGDPTPSDDDKTVTKRIKNTCKLVDLKLLDHIIMGDTYYSFAENKLI